MEKSYVKKMNEVPDEYAQEFEKCSDHLETYIGNFMLFHHIDDAASLSLLFYVFLKKCIHLANAEIIGGVGVEEVVRSYKEFIEKNVEELVEYIKLLVDTPE